MTSPISADYSTGTPTLRRYAPASGRTAVDGRGAPSPTPTTVPRTRDVHREGPAAAPTIPARNARTPAGAPATVRAGDLARTDEARRRATPTLAPANASPEERFRHYADIVRANGGTVNPNGQPTVLGLRGLSRNGSTHDTGSTRAYDDTFVVLRPDGRAFEYQGATHPGQDRGRGAPDVSGDRIGDVGMIQPGNYSADPHGPHAGNSSWHVTRGGNDRISGIRDTNGDGVFSDAERAASARRGDTLDGILFHQGNSTHPASIGCQTFAPRDFSAFMRQLGGAGSSFNYTLVDAYRR